MLMENDYESQERPEGLDVQDGQPVEEAPAPETLLPTPELGGSDPPTAENAVDSALHTKDGVGENGADAGDPSALGQGGPDPVSEALVGDALPEGMRSTEQNVAEQSPKRKRSAPRKKAAPKEDGPSPPSETSEEKQDELEKDENEKPGQGSEIVRAAPAALIPDQALTPVDQLQVAPKPAPGRPGASVVRRRALEGLDLREMDRYLSDEQRQEWNEIYASYRSKTVLSGNIVGVDQSEFNVKNRDTGGEELQRMHTVIVIPYRVKVLIPESEMWMPGDERPGHVLRNMVGAKIEFSILDLDREGECAIGSRRMALAARRHMFSAAKSGHREGEKLTCQMLAVGPKRCLVDCNGYDLNLSQRELTYTAVADLRDRYHPGQELPCVLKEYNATEDKLTISVKEINPNPFVGADQRHPINSRRQAVISGKYGGGVFCTLPDDTTCLCLYSAQHNDSDFHIGDTVIIAIKQYDYKRQLIYGRILSRW